MLWCCFLWRTRFISCTYDFPHPGRDVVQQAHLLRSRSRQWMDGCFHFHLGSDIQRKSYLSLHTPPSVTRNPQTSSITFLSRRKISPKMLWIGTCHSLTSEQPCIQDRNTEKLGELSYLSNMTSKEEEEEIILVKYYSLTRIKLTVQTNNLTKSTFTCISTTHHSCQIFTPTYTQSTGMHGLPRPVKGGKS